MEKRPTQILPHAEQFISHHHTHVPIPGNRTQEPAISGRRFRKMGLQTPGGQYFSTVSKASQNTKFFGSQLNSYTWLLGRLPQ